MCMADGLVCLECQAERAEWALPLVQPLFIAPAAAEIQFGGKTMSIMRKTAMLVYKGRTSDPLAQMGVL